MPDKKDAQYMKDASQRLNRRMPQEQKDKATIASYPRGTGKLHRAGAPEDEFSRAVERQYARENPHSPSFRKGGKVHKTGLAKVHKGERVLTRKQNMKYGRSAHK